MSRVVTTPCKGCPFAICDNGLQLGCHLGLASRHLAQGRVRQDGDDFVIDGVCHGRKPDGWGADLPLDQKKAEARASFRPRYHALVTSDGNLDLLGETLVSAKNQAEGPHRVSVFLTDPAKAPPVVELLRRGSFPLWHVHRVLDGNVGRAIDEALAKDDSVYYARVRAGRVLPDDFFANLSEALFGTERFLVLEDDGEAVVVQTLFHRLIGGNEPAEVGEAYGGGEAATLLAKARLVCKDQGKEMMVRPLTEIAPCR